MKLKTFRIKATGFLLSILLCIPVTGICKVWKVGPSRTYRVPSQVANRVSDGDTVEIDAGYIYADCADWNNNRLFIEGVGNGYAHIQDTNCDDKGIWNIYGENVTVEHIEFSGAADNDSLPTLAIAGGCSCNGAGIRSQGGSLTIRYCYFHDNQMGILESPDYFPADSINIIIEYSVFAYNGMPNNQNYMINQGLWGHNIYIGHCNSFTMRYCYSHGCYVGHEVKTRAYKNYILYNRITNNEDGQASRNIDIPNGGQAVIMGNLIEKGPLAENSNAIELGLEGLSNPGPQVLYLINNTYIDDLGGSIFLYQQASNAGIDSLYIQNNIIAGYVGTLFSPYGAGMVGLDSATNMVTQNIPYVGLVNPLIYNYHLLATSPAIDKGSTPGRFDTLVLTPGYEYVDSAATVARPRPLAGKKIDLGAYEYSSAASVENTSDNTLSASLLSNPSSAPVLLINNLKGSVTDVYIYDVTGRQVDYFSTRKNEMTLNTSSLAVGVYIVKAYSENLFYTGKFLVIGY